MCLYVYYTVVLYIVNVETLMSGVRYISIRLNYAYYLLLPSGGVSWNSKVQASDVTCHLVAVRGKPTWECDRDIAKVTIRFVAITH
jgi:hypothetical protein